MSRRKLSIINWLSARSSIAATIGLPFVAIMYDVVSIIRLLLLRWDNQLFYNLSPYRIYMQITCRDIGSTPSLFIFRFVSHDQHCLRSTLHFMFLSDEGTTFKTLYFAFYIGSTATFLYFDLYFNTAYAGQHIFFFMIYIWTTNATATSDMGIIKFYTHKTKKKKF